MRRFLTNLRAIAIAGFFFVLPVYIVAAVITKAWMWLSSVGKNVAGMLGVKPVLGMGENTIVTGLLLIASWIVCGFLVRVSFMAAFSKRVDRWLSQLIPGYDTYKTIAEEKVGKKGKIIPYAVALIQRQEYWQPAYVVEQDGNYVSSFFRTRQKPTKDTSCLRGRNRYGWRRRLRPTRSMLR